MRTIIAVLGLVGPVLLSCSDDDSLNASETITWRLYQCGLITNGKVSVGAADIEIAECRAACQARATCDELSALMCRGASSDRLQSCYTDCLSLPCENGQGTYLFVQRCDGRAQCTDQSDERACPVRGSLPEFCSLSGARITPLMRCNGVDDCGDGTDERGCPASAQPFTCPSGVPGIGLQISRDRVCDLVPDCPTGADESVEQGCAQLDCPRN